ncbi:hypothetical protein CDEST_02293 [Colletotrichum destructivum]|uniref:Uncharacterized protein n=1 Tax=Colletotrichum destructivum TaxID=34406 RepID=A0AAX4I237_9PEZI|nr:hypothetical protein CDEST_02293 [Colletotrichum destructivum]
MPYGTHESWTDGHSDAQHASSFFSRGARPIPTPVKPKQLNHSPHTNKLRVPSVPPVNSCHRR